MKKIQKTLFMLIYTLFVMTAGFAADFTWNGSQSSAWNNRSNWTPPVGLPSSDPGYPDDSSDTAIITSNGTSPILNSSIDINSLIINSGTLTIQGNITLTLSGNFTNNGGTFRANAGTVKLNSSGYDIQINGTTNTNNTQFHHLLMEVTDGTSKTLTIKNKIKINGDLSLKGSATDRVLAIKGSADIGSHEITLTANNTKEGYNLKVYDNIITTRSYITNQSKPEPQTSSPSGWIFKDCTSLMTWTAGASSAADKTKWDNYDNWKPKGVPGINTPVEIPYLTSNEYPKLENSTNARAQSVTVVSGAELDLQHFVIKKGSATAKLTNNGTIKMTGTGDQSDWFTATAPNEKIILGDTSTVEYNAPPPSAANVWAGPYENLKVSGSRHSLSASSITVRKNFTVNSSGLTQTGGNFFFSGNGSGTIDGTGTINFHDLTVTSGRTVKLNKAITVNGNFTNNSGATFNANGNNVTFGGNFKNDGTFTSGSNTVTFNGSSIISGNGAINFHNLTVANNKNVTLNKAITINGAFTNNGGATFNAGTHNITLNSTFSNSGTFNSADGTNNTFTFKGFFTNSGTFYANADNITFTGSTFTNSGTITAGTNNTVTLNPTGTTVTITGTGNASKTAFRNLMLTAGGGKTLTIDKKISVSGNLTLRGTNAGNPLTIDGGSSTGTESPEIVLTATNTTRGQYLKVRTNIPITGGTYRTSDSFPYASAGDPAIGNGNPAGWIFDDYNGTLTWKGTYSANWNDWQNWNIPGTPGVNSVVTIEKKPTSPPLTHYYPILTANVSAKSVTIEQGAELDLGAYIIQDSGAGSAVTTHITNNGTLKMDGTATGNPGSPGQKEWLELINTSPTNNNITHGNNSTIEYYGSTDNHIWQGPYKNLSLNNRDRLTINNQPLTVSSHLKIHNKHAIIDTGSGDQTYSGNISADEIPGTNPKKRYNIKFQTNGTVTTQHAVTAGDIHVTGNWKSDPVDNAPLNIASTGKIEVGGTWTAGSDSFTAQVNISLKGNLSAGAFIHKKGSLTFNGTGSPEQEINFTGTGQKNIRNLIVDNGSSSPASNAKVKLLSSVMIAENFTNKGAFNANNNDISLDGSFTNSGTFNTGTGNSLVFNSTFTNNGIFNADADTIVFSGNTFTNSGTFIAGANNTVNLSPSGNIAITGTDTAGNTKFHTLKLINAGGKTLTVNGKISVTGNMTLRGTNAGNPLTIDGGSSTGTESPEIVLTAANTTRGQYLKVRTNIPITGGTYRTSDSFPYASAGDPAIGNGNPAGWIFDDYNGTLTWKGNYSSNWNDWQNWNIPGTPGVNSVVTIPTTTHNYPKLESTTNAKAKSVTVNSGAELDLGDWTIQTSGSTAQLDSSGHLKLKGSANQKVWFEQTTPANKMTVQQDSTVEYNGTPSFASDVWQGPYPHLIVSGNKTSFDNANSLTVNQTFTVNTAGALTIRAPNQNYTGTVTLNKATNFNSSGGTVFDGPISASGVNITFNGNGHIQTKNTVTAINITVNTGTGAWTSSGTITANDITVNRSWTATNNIVASGDVNITGTWQSASVTASNITAHTWTSSGNVTSRGNITASDWTAKNVSLKGNLTAAQFNQTDGTLTFNGTGTPEQELKFTGATKNINNLTIDNGSSSPASNAKVKLLSSVMIAGDFTNKGTFDATSTGSPPGYTVTLTNNDHIINSSGTTNFHKLECTNAGGKTLTINGNITVDGDLNISGTAPNNYLNIKGPGKITLGDDQKPDSGTPPQRGYYLNIDTNIPITDGHTYTVTESKANEISGFPLSDGHPKNWIFLNCTDTKLTWNGSQSTDWGKFDPTVFTFSNDSYKNWSPWGIPGEKTEVIIPSNKPRYPKLENSTNAKAKSVAVNTGAELYLEDQIITLASGQKLTNGGKVYLKNVSTPAQSTWISNFVHNPGSTIVYKDVTNASNTIWQGPYRNLIFESTVPDTIQAPSLTVNETLTVNKNITINTTGAQSYNIIEASAKDLTFTAPSLTTSGNVNMNKINATGVSTWTASNGDIKLTGNLSASKFTQTGGKLTFNKGDGVTVQTLTLTNTASEVFSLEVSSSSILHLTTPITLISSFVNAGKFDALDQDVTLKPTGTISITGTTTQTDTKFGNLSCEDAGEKTFKVKNKISVQGDLNLSGTPLTTKLLTIDTDSAAEIYLNKSFGSIADGGAKGAYLKINTDKVSIKDKKYYVVDKSVDHEGKLKNKNGWIFVKEGLKIENSFAKPNDDNIYLLFNNLYLTKEEFNTLGDGALTIEASGSTTYSSDLQTVDEITVPTIPTGHSLWKIKLKTRINPDDILNKNYKVMLKYFVTPANITKNYISDIGINIADPLKAFNSIVLYTFNANDEPGLATLDITIPTKKEATSDNVKLYFTSKGSTGRFWFPNTITPTPSNISSFADSLTGATEYLGTPEGGLLNFIIRATDPHLKKGMVGQFMYVYDGWLPCARLKDSNNILSFDVWNFNIAGVQKQKGGVSIFDNVVNPHKGQSAKIAAHLKKSGMLTIQIMTLDGNVVRTLARSHKNAGDHVYTWDGRNKGGNPVASGMYFVRIAGPEIDEVRKILVIK